VKVPTRGTQKHGSRIRKPLVPRRGPKSGPINAQTAPNADQHRIPEDDTDVRPRMDAATTSGAPRYRGRPRPPRPFPRPRSSRPRPLCLPACALLHMGLQIPIGSGEPFANLLANLVGRNQTPHIWGRGSEGPLFRDGVVEETLSPPSNVIGDLRQREDSRLCHSCHFIAWLRRHRRRYLRRNRSGNAIQIIMPLSRVGSPTELSRRPS
jgi:hypothetical protein